MTQETRIITKEEYEEYQMLKALMGKVWGLIENVNSRLDEIEGKLPEMTKQ